MLIKHVYTYTKARQLNELKNLYIDPNGQWQYLESDTNYTGQVIDAEKNLIVLPGLLDTHIHGYGGGDFSEVGEHPECLPQILYALGQTGLSYVMATLVSLPMPKLKQCLQELDQFIQKPILPGSSKIVGVHLEGPFIDKNCKGAHAESALQSHIDLAVFKEIISAAPHITQWKVTLAPDLPGAITFIEEVKSLRQAGIFVHVFLGHTNPEKVFIDQAVDAGAEGFTHLGNACKETCCRMVQPLSKQDAQSQLVQWVLENPIKCPKGVELIVDGVHLSSSFVRLIENHVPQKIVLVSDALGPSGLNDGKYQLGSLPIEKRGRSFYLLDQPEVLAGSAASLVDCLYQYSQWLKLEHQLAQERVHRLYTAVIENPRLSLDASFVLPDEKNFVLIDTEGKLHVSLCNGQLRVH